MKGEGREEDGGEGGAGRTEEEEEVRLNSIFGGRAPLIY